MVFQDESAAIPKEKVPFAEQVERYRVPPGARVTLADYPPDPSEPLKRGRAQKLLKRLRKQLNSLQELLYATGDHAVLVVLQGMDTSGKDGVIKRVVSAFNPQGFEVSGFKVPTPEELAHDFLWRVHARVPRRGMVGVFNRSHYEDVLVVRVDGLVPEPVWRQRYAAIREFEALLAANGVVIVKFFLNISKEEQAACLRQARGPHRALEVPQRRPERQGQVGRLHGGLRGGAGRVLAARGALVCSAGQQQGLPRRRDRAGAGEPVGSPPDGVATLPADSSGIVIE